MSSAMGIADFPFQPYPPAVIPGIIRPPSLYGAKFEGIFNGWGQG